MCPKPESGIHLLGSEHTLVCPDLLFSFPSIFFPKLNRSLSRLYGE